MKLPVRQYKQIIKQRARKLRNNPTNSEKAMWEILRMGNLKGLRFLRQHPILFNVNNSVHFFIPDFYCPKYKLIIEVDGDTHDKKEQKEHDYMRTVTLKEMGMKIIRFKNEDVMSHKNIVIKHILSSLPLPKQGKG